MVKLVSSHPYFIASLLYHNVFSLTSCCKFLFRLKPKQVVDDSPVWDPPLELSSAAEGVDSPDREISEEPEEEPEEFQPQLKLPVHLKDLKVRVSHVNSPSSFYVQLTKNDSQFKRSAVTTQNRDLKILNEFNHKEASDIIIYSRLLFSLD